MSEIDELLKSVKAKLKTPGPRRDTSIEAWRNYFYNLDHTSGGPLDEPSNWIYSREVRIFKMPQVDEKVVNQVKAGIEELINQIGLDFRVNYYGIYPSVVDEVYRSLQADGSIDGMKLGEILAAGHWREPKFGERPHATAVIVDRFLYKVGDIDWGRAEYSNGYIVIALPGTRQNSLEFIGKIAKHEASRLFGFGENHDGDYTNVNGYRPVQDCNMLWQAPTRFTCDKCADALTYFWKGIEARTGQRFFRS